VLAQGFVLVCGSTGTFCVLDLKEAVFTKDARKSITGQNHQTFHLRIKGLPLCVEGSGGDESASVSLLSHDARATAGVDCVFLPSTSSSALRVTRVAHSLEQCNAWQANQSDALSVEDEHLTSIGISRVHGSRHEVQRDDGNNVTLNHNTEYTPAETSSQSHADINIIASEENTLERAGGGSKVTQFAGGCTRMFPLRVEEGPGADTHMMLSYGGAIRSEADWNTFTGVRGLRVSFGASTAYSFDEVFGTKSLTDEVCQPSWIF
jgi:hypothetical protein